MVLGTAQLGLPYGISNTTGKIKFSAAEALIKCARESKIGTLDTAQAYGDSETVLGEIGVEDFDVVTKISAPPAGAKDLTGWLEKQLERSLVALKRDHVSGVLIHDPWNIEYAQKSQLCRDIERLKESGVVRKVGVSIYDPESVPHIFDFFIPDIIQAPFNLVDRRMLCTGALEFLWNSGVEIQARSVFLQGLLLLSREEIPEKFERWAHLWDRWHRYLDEHEADPITLCLSLYRDYKEVAGILVGVQSAEQLRQILNKLEETYSVEDRPSISCTDDMLVNPMNWSQL